jgi:hypothetical protein
MVTLQVMTNATNALNAAAIIHPDFQTKNTGETSGSASTFCLG